MSKWVPIVLLVLLAGCTQTQEQPVPPTGVNTILIENFAFNPSVMTVPVGTSVTWVNKDSAPHTVQGEDFSSSTLNKEETFMNKFDTPGTFVYHCSIHPSMTGTIIVE
jgi:plastocyanin